MLEFNIERAIKHLTNELSGEEHELFESDLLNPQFKKQYNELKHIWNSSNELKKRYHQNELPNWSYLEKRFKFQEKMKWRQYASVAAILLISILSWVQFLPKTVSTGFNEQRTIVFSDGSTAKLNYSSEIVFEEQFTSDEQIVELNGEAFFSIVKDGIKKCI